jgi:hypothetical protein
MRKPILLSLAFGIITGLTAFAQQSLWGVAGIVSPEVKDNNTVTFDH